MPGKKNYQEKLFNSFQLSDRVPTTNFYRRLKEALNLNFLYELTQSFYGSSGQKSIDPVVFFKLCLVGYLENLPAGRLEYLKFTQKRVKSGAGMLGLFLKFNMTLNQEIRPF